jgi:phosphatidylinositol-3-phosphatase
MRGVAKLQTDEVCSFAARPNPFTAGHRGGLCSGRLSSYDKFPEEVRAMLIWLTVPFLLVAGAFPGQAAAAWAPYRVVVVIEENHGYDQIVGNQNAPFINLLANEGALFTNAHGVRHPSQPNYLALFSGSTQGVTDDSPVHGTPLKTPNLAAALIGHGYTFTGFSESQPGVGSTVQSANGLYLRKHNPWSNWQSSNPAPNQLSASVNETFASFPSDFERLPTVAFVVPNINNDEHGNETISDQQLIRMSDDWLEKHLGLYVQWAKSHNSLLIVTWDEDNYTPANHIPTILVGSNVKSGKYDQRIDHYNVLRMIEDFYGLPHIGASGTAAPIVDAFP